MSPPLAPEVALRAKRVRRVPADVLHQRLGLEALRLNHRAAIDQRVVVHEPDVDRNADPHRGPVGRVLAQRRRTITNGAGIHVVLGLELQRAARIDRHRPHARFHRAPGHVQAQRRAHAHRIAPTFSILGRGLLVYLQTAVARLRLRQTDRLVRLRVRIAATVGLLSRGRGRRLGLARAITAGAQTHRPTRVHVPIERRTRVVIYKRQRNRHPHRCILTQRIALGRGGALTMMIGRERQRPANQQPPARAQARLGVVVHRHRQRQRPAHARATSALAAAFGQRVDLVRTRGAQRHILATRDRRTVGNHRPRGVVARDVDPHRDPRPGAAAATARSIGLGLHLRFAGVGRTQLHVATAGIDTRRARNRGLAVGLVVIQRKRPRHPRVAPARPRGRRRAKLVRDIAADVFHDRFGLEPLGRHRRVRP